MTTNTFRYWGFDFPTVEELVSCCKPLEVPVSIALLDDHETVEVTTRPVNNQWDVRWDGFAVAHASLEASYYARLEKQRKLALMRQAFVGTVTVAVAAVVLWIRHTCF